MFHALVRLSLNRESHLSIILGGGGINMQIITEHINDLLWYVMNKKLLPRLQAIVSEMEHSGKLKKANHQVIETQDAEDS